MSAPTAVSASTTSSSVLQLNQNDVIVKPGPSDSSHPGNTAFQRIVNLNKGSFKSASDKSERLRIAKTIVQTISESKGKFLERNADTGGWKEADNREATKMAIFALRGVAPVPVKAEVIDITDDNHGIKEEFVDETDDTPSVVAKPGTALDSSTKSSPQALQQKIICMSQLIKLGADQMTYSKYPVGCQVHYNTNTQTLPVTSQSEVKFIASVCRGKVNNVFMDLGSKQFIYEVVPTSNIEDKELLTETKLTYATGTPINVQFAPTESTHNGEVIGSKVATQELKKTYTVIVFTKESSAQIFDNVSSDNITYRLVKGDNVMDNSNTSKNTQELSSLGGDKMEEVSKAPSKSTTRNDTPPIEMVTKKRAADSPTASSITQEDNGANILSTRPAKIHKGGNELLEKVPTPKLIQPPHRSNQAPSSKPFPNHSAQAELSTSRNLNTTHPLRAGMYKPLQHVTNSSDETLIVKIPLWLQKTKELRLDLFHNLMGENPVMETGYKLKTLQFQTNCSIRVRGPEFGSKAHREMSSVMQVTIVKKNGNNPPSDPMRAKSVIVDSLMEFVGNDGSKAKLCYDLAASSKDNICRGSKYNAVFVLNPFSKANQRVCMALFALPSTEIQHQPKKTFHGGFLLKAQNTSRINRCKCTMILCGDQYKIPTKLCDPYGVIYGGNAADVHNAMDIVTECISKHRQSCSCNFSRLKVDDNFN